MAGKRVHELNLEFDGQFLHHKRSVRAIAAQFKADARMSSTDDAIAATREALSSQHPDLSFCGVIVSFPLATNDDGGFWDFRTCLPVLPLA